jgi:hypothetical protein
MSPLSSFANSLAKFSEHAGKISAPPCSVFAISVIWGVSLAIEKLQDDVSEPMLKKKILEACAVFGLCALMGVIAEIALYRFHK